MLCFEIEGTPIPWMRPGVMRTKKCNIIYDKQKKDKELIQWQLRFRYKEKPLTIPISVELIFGMPIPASTSGALRRQMLHGVVHHCKKPDLDNLTKFIFDAMNGLIYVDDAQISVLSTSKIYSSVPSTLIRIRPLTIINQQIKQEENNGDYLRDDGSGCFPGDYPEPERPKKTRGKKTNIIPFGNG